MTQATLTFDLPTEQHEHLCAVHGQAFYGALHAIDQELRSLLKHDGIDALSASALAEQMRAQIADALALIDG